MKCTEVPVAYRRPQYGHSNFFFNTAFDHVTILNQSAKNLIVNNIDVSQIPGVPPIQIIGSPNNFTYDVFTNAVDSDWAHHHAALTRAGVRVRFLCPQHVSPDS